MTREVGAQDVDIRASGQLRGHLFVGPFLVPDKADDNVLGLA